jgi:hypothetical protein
MKVLTLISCMFTLGLTTPLPQKAGLWKIPECNGEVVLARPVRGWPLMMCFNAVAAGVIIDSIANGSCWQLMLCSFAVATPR